MNQLKVNRLEEIILLKSQGWSARRIARELNIDRETVGKYLRNGAAKPATLTRGSPEEMAEREVDRALAAARVNVSLCELELEIRRGSLRATKLSPRISRLRRCDRERYLDASATTAAA
jgi:DNA-binding CsgD family transcriptional regulator